MKVFVLGAAGMAGHVIALKLKNAGYEVLCLARKPLAYCDTIVSDVREIAKVKEIIINQKIDVVVNAIGILNSAVDSNFANAVWINSYLPHALVEITKNTSTRIIHLSTDCVFSGSVGGYLESDFCCSTDNYGKTKAAGEIKDDKNLTIRTSMIGADMNEDGIGLFNWFMKQTGSIKGYDKAIWTGVTTNVLAEAIDAAISQNTSGLYHLTNNRPISKYNLLRLFNKLRVSPVNIELCSSHVVDKSLINTRTDFNFEVSDYEDMIAQLSKWISSKQTLYKHYVEIVGARLASTAL